MTDEWPKLIKYRGAIIALNKCGDHQFEYYLTRHTGGRGFLSEAAARRAAKKAVDRKLAREAVK